MHLPVRERIACLRHPRKTNSPFRIRRSFSAVGKHLQSRNLHQPFVSGHQRKIINFPYSLWLVVSVCIGGMSVIPWFVWVVSGGSGLLVVYIQWRNIVCPDFLSA